METLSPSDMDEMVTLYSLDGDGIALIHFCPTNNQPRMRFVPAGDNIKELILDFQGAGNLSSSATGHEHHLVIRLGRCRPHHRNMDVAARWEGHADDLPPGSSKAIGFA